MMLTDEVLYLSKGTTHMLRGKYEVLEELKGSDMIGWTYDGPFDELPAEQEPGGWTELRDIIKGIDISAKDAHRVIAWEEVSEEEGTGIVHIAPGAGAEVFGLGKESGLSVVAPLNDEGVFVDGFDWLTGNSSATYPISFSKIWKKRAFSTTLKNTATATPPAGAAKPNWFFAWSMSGSSIWTTCARC